MVRTGNRLWTSIMPIKMMVHPLAAFRPDAGHGECNLAVVIRGARKIAAHDGWSVFCECALSYIFRDLSVCLLESWFVSELCIGARKSFTVPLRLRVRKFIFYDQGAGTYSITDTKKDRLIPVSLA